MEEQNMTYQEALSREIVKEGDYFLVKYPDGRDILFRLVKREAGYVMWGMRTTEEIYLYGKGGYDNSLILADNQVRKEYSFEGVFEEVHALGLPEKEYEFHSSQEYLKFLEEKGKIFEHPDDAKMCYFLASRCVAAYSKSEYFCVFAVDIGYLRSNALYSLWEGMHGYTIAVRPEAIPDPQMRISMEKCDGSKENPWICLSK